MKILITGVSGFIGFHLAIKLLKKNFEIIGIDNMNNYYNNDLKFDRLNEIEKISRSNFKFIKVDINNESSIKKIFRENKFDVVIHLAAQAGVRFSIDNPKAYIDTNIRGFFNVIDASYKSNVELFLTCNLPIVNIRKSALTLFLNLKSNFDKEKELFVLKNLLLDISPIFLWLISLKYFSNK